MEQENHSRIHPSSHFPFPPTRTLAGLMLLVPLAACGIFQFDITISPSGGPTAFATAQGYELVLPPEWTPTATTKKIPDAIPVEPLDRLSALEPNIALDFISINMTSPSAGWAVTTDGHLTATSDGGRTWKDATPPGGTFASATFFAWDAQTAWAAPLLSKKTTFPVGDGILWRTLDGGTNWQEIRIAMDSLQGKEEASSTQTYQPYNLFFLNAKTGWLLAKPAAPTTGSALWALLSTQDGGISWAPVAVSDHAKSASPPESPVCIPATLAFSDEDTGWLATDCPDAGQFSPLKDIAASWGVMQTQNGGTDWRWMPLPLPDAVTQLAQQHPEGELFCNTTAVNSRSSRSVDLELSCVPEGNALDPFRYSYHSANNGFDWAYWLETGSNMFPGNLPGWRFTPPNKTTSGGVFRTLDAGKNWEKVFSVAWSAATLECLNAETCWALVTMQDTSSLLYTADEGKSWKDLKPGTEDPYGLCTTGKLSQYLSSPTGNKPTEKFGFAFSTSWKSAGTAIGHDVRLWDMSAKKPSALLTGHSGKIISVAISPDGALTATGGADGTIRLWRTDSGDWQRTLHAGGAAVESLAFSPDGRQLASGSWDYSVRLWRSADGALLSTQKNQRGWIMDLAFSPNGRLLASASADYSVVLWEVSSTGLAAVRSLAGHTDSIHAAAFSPDGYMLATASGDKTIRLWQTESGLLLRTITGFDTPLTGVALSPDGKLLLSGTQSGMVQLWRPTDAASLCTISTLARSSTAAAIPDNAFSPDTLRIGWGTSEGMVWVWEGTPPPELKKT